MPTSKVGIRASAPSPVYDTDALAYFNANTAIASTADKSAINTFYLGLKSDGIYTKIKAMYLPIWGSAATCKWNLANTSAYSLTYYGTSWTFTNDGMLASGTGYADSNLSSHLVGSTSIDSARNMHISFYSNTSTTSNQNDMGAFVGSPTNSHLTLNCRDGSNYYRGGVNTGAAAILVSQVTDARGFHILSRNNTTSSQRAAKNGVYYSTAASMTDQPSRNIYLCGWNGSSIHRGQRRCSFASIGSGLSDAQMTSLNNRVNTLMTHFGINTY